MIRPMRKPAQRPNPGRARASWRARLLRRCIFLTVAAAWVWGVAGPADAAAPAAQRGGRQAERTPSTPSQLAPSVTAAFRPPRIVSSGIIGGLRGGTAASRLLARAPGSPKSFPLQIASYPRQGQIRVPQNATLYIVFDQPTLKVATISVADLDASGGLLNLQALAWSAQGDTVFIRALNPMAFGHQHGMKLNTVLGTDSVFAPDYIYPIVYFTVIARANLTPVSLQSENRTTALAPGVPTPMGVTVRETAGTEADFTSGSVTFLNAAGAPIDSVVRPVSIRVPRNGVADLKLPVTLPRSVAAGARGGRLSARLTFYGTDETQSAVTYALTLPVVAAPSIASTAVIESAVLEWPLQGAAVAAGDTLLPRAVVMGSGTGPFRAAFWLDGELLAIEEGYLDAGRPATVTMRGPIPTRRLGEHRLTFVVEEPQSVSARPVSFICVPPMRGLAGSPGAANGVGGPPAAPAAQRLKASATFLGTGQSKFREQGGSGIAWGFGSARYDLGGGAALEANASLRFRADDPANGSARPEQMRVRLLSRRGSAEWGDAAPALADSAPLFMSAVPRRAAQGRYGVGELGEVQGYVAVESRPVSAGGLADQTRADLYAGRLTRAFARERVEVSAYGGYAHADPTPGGGDAITRAQSVWGGMGRVLLYRDWTLLADAASVRHRRFEGVEPGRTRSGWRSELSGSVAGVRTLLQGFRYQPDLATALNPYALSNRVGGAAEASRGFGQWRFTAGFRSEQPAERVGLMPVVRVDQLRVGGTLALNACSWVTPAFVRTTHRGAGTDYTENRLQGEFTRCEPRSGQTTARLDAATYRDSKVANARRRVYSGSLVSTLRQGPGATSTLTLGYEEDIHEDLDKTNRTIQGTFETRWEAVAGRLLVTPYFTGSSRDYEASGTRETRLGGRLQFVWLRFADLGENALALTGRVERVNTKLPVSTTATDAGVEISWGQRFDW